MIKTSVDNADDLLAEASADLGVITQNDAVQRAK